MTAILLEGAALPLAGRAVPSSSVSQRLSPRERAAVADRSRARGDRMIDEQRLERAVGAHLGFVWRLLRRAGLNEADADEAAQDVFWIYASRAEGVPVRAERSFLVTTALRVASDRRKLRWNRSATETLDADHPDRHGETPESLLERRRARRLLDEAMDTLDDEHRTVFQLVELEQLTRQEAAELLGLPPGTVASRLKRARELFEREALRLRARFGGGGR